MDFTYDNLQDAWLHDVRIGNWKGKPVYSVRKDHINEECVNGVYYVVFDDGYKIIGIDSSNRLKEYGSIDKYGNVDEHFAPLKYSAYVEEKSKPAYVKEKPQVAEPQVVVEEPAAVIADVQIGIDVDATLQAARVMTVDSLLEGFNYGLD
jgi:hypothetical protein